MKSLKMAVTCLLLCSITSCSLFAPSTQSVTVNSTVPKVNISANGQPQGQTPVTFQAKRNQTLQIVATKPGYQPATYSVDRRLSQTAMLDIVGGVFFGLPFLGLLGQGAWELEQDSVTVPLSR